MNNSHFQHHLNNAIGGQPTSLSLAETPNNRFTCLLWKQVRFLTGKTFLPQPDAFSRINEARTYILDILLNERQKAKAGSALYNSNRHITFNQVLRELYDLRERFTPRTQTDAGEHSNQKT